MTQLGAVLLVMLCAAMVAAVAFSLNVEAAVYRVVDRLFGRRPGKGAPDDTVDDGPESDWPPGKAAVALERFLPSPSHGDNLAKGTANVAKAGASEND